MTSRGGTGDEHATARTGINTLMGLADRDYARQQPRRGAAYGAPSLPPVTKWLIIINVAVFILDQIFASQGIGYIVTINPGPPPQTTVMPLLETWGHFSTQLAFVHGQVWRFITFQFLHANFDHILFNMIGLYFFGPVVERSFRSGKTFLAYYLCCGICGAALYLFLNMLGSMGVPLPGFLNTSILTPLVGASAGIFGILIGAAFVAGNATMLIMMVIPTTVRMGAYLLLALAFFNLVIGGKNAGGDAAHIGGAIAGFILIRHPHFLEDFFHIFGPPKPRKNKPARSGSPSASTDTPTLKERQRVDDILAKVSRQGLQSLTAEERAFLEAQSRKEGNPLQ